MHTDNTQKICILSKTSHSNDCESQTSLVTHKTRPKPKQTLGKKAKKRSKISTWRYLRKNEKLALSIAEIADRGGTTLTLNLSPDVENEIREHGMKRFYDRLCASMRREFGEVLPFVLSLDVTYSHARRVHIHGAIATTDPSQINRLHLIFKRAAGLWDSKRNKERQLDLRPITDAEGWASYITRNHHRLKHVPGQLIASTNTLRRLAKSRNKASEFTIQPAKEVG